MPQDHSRQTAVNEKMPLLGIPYKNRKRGFALGGANFCRRGMNDLVYESVNCVHFRQFGGLMGAEAGVLRKREVECPTAEK
jgi:hypothetical protein